MFPLCQERERYDYAGYTVVIVEDRVDHDWSAVARKKGGGNAEILAGWHPQAHLAAQEIERLIDERVRAEAAQVDAVERNGKKRMSARGRRA